MLPETMTAITIEGGHGPAEALKAASVPLPPVADGQILIAVRAAGVNRPDLFQRMGLYPPPPGASDILGLEVAGEVVKAAGRWQVGDRVCALLPGGGYAGYAACDACHVLPMPAGYLGWAEAAALPETVITVYANVFEDGRLQAGETLLIHGANSGIGVTAIQMAKAAGAKVIATARNAEKAGQAKALGADVVVDTSREDFAEVVTRHGGADVILEMLGGDYFAGDLRCLNYRGRIVFIAALAAPEVSLPVFLMMQKHAVITGSTLRARTADEKARLAAAVEAKVWPWVAAGKIAPQINRRFPLAEAAAAHAYMESGQLFGKIVLDLTA